MSTLGDNVARATSGMLNRTLFVALSTLVGSKAELGALLKDHLAFMVGLEESGVLFASGPFIANGESDGDGMTIVRATSADEAREILNRDPLVIAKVRKFDLREWHLMEGNIQVTVLASRQRGALP